MELFAVILAVLTCLPLINTFCISLSKLRRRLFTVFTVYIVSVFLACFYNGHACDRFSARSCYNNNNNTLIYIAPACRMTSEALADSSSRATECLTEK